MKKNKVLKLNGNAVDEMLTVIGLFDLKQKEISKHYSNGSETGPFLDYNIDNDSTISVNYGWSDYEEGDNNDVVIKFLNDGSIRISKVSDGYSVMVGEYQDSEIKIATNTEELIDWLNNEIG